MDTLATRWSRLEPHVTIVGPDDDRPRPAVLLFHGCGGLRGHLPRYAAAAKARGWRAVIVDSYAPRGWSRQFAMATVCTGLLLRGWERAGDILATIHGVSARPEVDASTLVLAGWSHGGWGIMEAMSADRERAGALGLVDAGAVSLEAVKATYLAYPYVGVAALNRMRPWRHCPKTLAVVAAKDHLTTVRNAERVHAMVRNCGAEVETWIADGTHSFDEPMTAPPMRYDDALCAEAIRRFAALLEDTAVAPPV
ncbi:dienelactone hydrolase family protein [Brevundimonas aurifodinae]|uniref:Dienelactone hydrolase family protein n=2 Tax=Brevundimonas TaxID=41275 RepID=A0ABV1NMB6_9CAUL|nr:MAG: dienelactone hydrolase [Brevundimonas sp. 12-68-7]OYX34785.1 MAG: dienelactone hydrolase [Brevundimonas subvibrioides]